MNILTVNLVLSSVVFFVAAKIYLLPHLHRLEPRTVLTPILLLHMMRHLGLMFLAPGAIYAGIPTQFTVPAAYGDFLAAILAGIALAAILMQSGAARVLVWIFNIEGSLDLALAIALATLYNAPPLMGPAYWIPAFWVPALIVTHAIVFVVLLKHWR
ncbi:MAG TPA: hypothetical protein VJL90_01390 [Pseudorhodoplanes sp.]|nr:hypothetical protein [Pseudorhodoplanes sp.]